MRAHEIGDETRSSGVYLLNVSGANDKKVYIGSTAGSFVARWRNHMNACRRGTHHNVKLQRAFNKYGVNALEFFVIEDSIPEGELLGAEQKWIDEYRAKTESRSFLNIAKQAGATRGIKRRDSTCEKISMANAGRKFTDEHKRKLSEAAKKRDKSKYCWKNLGLDETKLEKRRQQAREMCVANMKASRSDPAVEQRRKDAAKLASAKTRKAYSGFVSPDGHVFKDVVGLLQFCRDHKLTPQTMSHVASGKIKEHRGWRLFVPLNTDGHAAEQQRVPET